MQHLGDWSNLPQKITLTLSSTKTNTKKKFMAENITTLAANKTEHSLRKKHD